MRRLRYSVAMSLDGYIAGPNGEADWIVMDPDLDFTGMFSEFDTLLMGRGTFGAAGGMAGGEFKTIVVSRTLDPRKHPRVTILSEKLKASIASLKAQPGKDIWLFGGGQLFRSLLDLELVDTVEVGVIPVLLGGGIPLLPAPARKVSLRLTNHQVFAKTGTLALSYDIDYATAPGKASTRKSRAKASAKKR